MSFTHFSQNELQALRFLFREHGWHIKGSTENLFRYSISKANLLVLTLKFPIRLPFKIEIPFEFVNFKISIVFKLWNLNQNSNEIITYFQKWLKGFAKKVSLQIKLPIERKKREMIDLIEEILPEMIVDENERAWVNRIRISLMNKSERFKKLEEEDINDIVDGINHLGLKPTFETPWELKKGIPKMRVSETLFFSTEEPFDEFFILEKDHFWTYFKDIEVEKFYIRTFFESYSPHFLSTIFKDSSDVNLNVLVEKWIKFSRLVLNSVLKIFNSVNFPKSSLASFKPKKEIESRDFISEEHNFPLSALHYEGRVAKNLHPVQHDLLNRPPKTFAIIEHLNYYSKAEDLIEDYKFSEANSLLVEALKIFNKFKQKKAVVAILFLLKRVASILNQQKVALNYLNNALSIAKSGEVPIDYVIKIHYELGKLYMDLSKYKKAQNHFDIISNFLGKEELSFERKKEYIGISSIYLGLIYQQLEEKEKGEEAFKVAFDLMNDSMKIRLEYHLIRIKFYKKVDELKHAQKLLKMAVKTIDFENVPEEYDELLLDLFLELSEYFIHFKEEKKNANYYLSRAKSYLATNDISGIKATIRWNLLMRDFFRDLLSNEDKALTYYKKSQNLKAQLTNFGVE